MPIGVRGELYLGGVQVGRGYLGRPELTAERFVPDPFGEEPGARMYRTGDLARLSTDGEVEYLGRVDHQVKLRGFRIELGEIEAALAQHPEVREAVALVIEAAGPSPGARDEQRLVAYVTPLDVARPPGGASLRAWIKVRVPEYMVPSTFVAMDDLPRTPSGKIDRKALSAVDRRPHPRRRRRGYVAPREQVEEILARVWQAVLRVDRVGVHDNFFALGGDSILSIQLVSRAAREGIRLTARQIFQHQTIAELAANADVTEARAIAGADDAAGPVPLTPIQSWFFEHEIVDAHHWNQALMVQTRERIDDAVAERVVAALLDHHDALSLRFERDPGQGVWRARVAPPGQRRSPLSCVDLGGLPQDERRGALERAAGEAQASLDLGEGPILRVVLFHVGDAEPDRVLLAIHHLAIDGVSWRVLLEDFSIAYEAIRRGEPVALPPRTTSFKRWAERLAAHARGSEVLAEAPFWLAEGRARVRPLPRDLPGGDRAQGSREHALGVRSTPTRRARSCRRCRRPTTPRSTTRC